MKKWNRKRPLAAAGAVAVCSVLFCMLFNLLAVCIAAGVLFLSVLLFCLMRKYQTAIFALITAGVFTFCALSFFYKEYCVVEPTKALLDQTVTVTGTVCEAPLKKENSTLIRMDNCTVNGVQTKLKLNVYCKRYDPAEIGDIFYVEAADIFSFAEQGVFYYHTLSEGNWLRAYTHLAVNTGKTDSGFIYKIKRFRAGIRDMLIQNLGDTDGGIAAALLTGDRTALSDAFTSDLRITGGSHMFAVSGMHLSIWTGIIFWVFRRRSRIKILPNIAASAFALCYMAVTGFSPSVVRAGIMLIITFAGKMTKRLSDGLNSLGISALLLLMLNIYLPGNVSFLLSFTATWGIIALTPYFYFNIAKEGKKPNPLQKHTNNAINTVFVSLVALCFTVPISGYFFTGASLLSPVTTLLCALPVQITMISAFLSLCYSTIPYLGQFLFAVCGYGCKTISYFITALAKWDFCVLPVRLRFLLIWYFITGTVIILIYYRFGKKSIQVLIALLLSASLLLCVQITMTVTAKKTPVIYIHAAGNNTAVTLNINGNAFCAQIGTGGSYEALEKIQAYHISNGVTKPDVLIIPRVSDAENGNTESFIHTAKTIYSAEGNETLYGLTENVWQADNFTLRMADIFTYSNATNADYSAGILKTDDKTIVFSFLPGGNYTEADDDFKSGDYLVCRGGIPQGLEPERYGEVIVLSDKTASELRLPKGVYSIADTGDIIINASASGN